MWHFNNYIYIENVFRNKQFKLTNQRKIVLDVLIENAEKKMSAEDVYLILQNRETGIGLATVYRTLELLEELALLEKMASQDGRNRYEIKKEEKENDLSQLICVSCGKVIHFKSQKMQENHQEIVLKAGFKALHQELKIYGYCNDCR